MPVLPVIILTVIIHIALLGTDIFMTNLWVHTPWYGGETGFMPTGKSTGADDDTTHPYDVVSNFLRGGEDGPQSQTDNLKDGSGLKIFQWIVRTPLCMLSTLIRFQLSLTTFTYDIVRILPDDGFGYWIQMAIPMVGTVLHLILLGHLLAFAVRAGVFSNLPMMAAILGISVLGTIATIAEGAGGLICS